MTGASHAKRREVASFVQETLSKLGIDVDVYVTEDEFAHNETRFLLFTDKFTQIPRIHKSSRVLSKNSINNYICSKKKGNYWKFSFDLIVESLDYSGSVQYTREFLTIKGRYKAISSDFDRIKAEFTPNNC